ncbi:Cell division-associated, ATP-dependent zinc metalloprotease FtsH [Candidatus Phytoplasma rubi]|uniref:ATP-dependent zinc metalloprotease FtsH n=1 Tax=Candidatus Phytoplasma rubi TaxID=399025 RepID=A0ABY7BTB2_9MOLU|nr:ATP-dependent zinc metalloprotease FtsH [Candidatus Phytoplasma rubi]WAN63552.1 Cell division-associated, ATP-dependent zinc metalloprotease FtsH [Candidatus Phytoplasma rubi]
MNIKKYLSKSVWGLIVIVLIVGILVSLYNVFVKNKNENIIFFNDSNINDIETIQPYLINSFPVMYDVHIKYKGNSQKKVYELVSEKEYSEFKQEFKHKINESKFKGPIQYKDFGGFGPLLSAFRLCLTIYFIYFVLKNLAGATSQLVEQFSDRDKIRTKKNKHSFKQPTLTFKDVAGAEEEKEELAELVDFLKNPKKYYLMGARIPKGVLLSGPPGTGKTLLAKALAGEAKVPFFAVSGSEFVEMFVGLGAARIRSLFKSAQEHAPCIIFIDEIETLARKRGMNSYGGNSEQEQTLNQLLIELDGYNQNQGVIVVAATNQPDFLDPALLRPGRLERRFIVNLPSVKDREAILKLHSLNKKISPDVSLEEVARVTSGFSGAQLEGILNEAALLTARNNVDFIDKKTISEAIDRILMGPAKKSVKYSEKEKKMISYHEAGHAVIGLKLKDSRKVEKVTIIPRGNSGGYNLFSNEEESFFSSKQQLLAEITSFLGGRAAEELFLDDVSNGAYQDFKMATNIAKKMVTIFGMSDLGLAQFEEGNNFHKNFSDPKALEIDQTIQKIIFNCYEKAKKIISENKELFIKITEYLLAIETLNKKDIQEIAETNKLSWFDKQKEQEKQLEEQKQKEIERQVEEEKKEEKVYEINDSD